MKLEEYQQLVEIESKIQDITSTYCTYDCVEYDNGTFACDECPIWDMVCCLSAKSSVLLR